MPDQFEQYYKYLKANGADVAPDFNSFKNTLSDYNNASKYYSYLKENKFDVPATYDSFADTFGLKKKDGGIVSSPTELPLQGFSEKQIGLLKKGVEKPVSVPSQKKSSGLVLPTNLPKQEALAYENELKLNDAAANTLSDIYKKKGLKFDTSRPAAKKQIQEYVDKSINGDLTKVTGKDGKEYLVRSQGFFESAGDSFVRSLTDPIESTEINFTSNPEELANLLDEKIRKEPNIPEEAPSAVSGYLGGLAGGLPKLAAIAAIPYIGQTAMVGEMYYNALANQRRFLYERGLQEGMDRVSAAKKAMEVAPVSAIPDALVAAVMVKGLGVGKASGSVIPNAAKESFIKASSSALKSIGLVSATGGFSEYERSKIQQRAGYNVTDAEAIENGFRGAGDYALMDAAFKMAHIGPKYLSSAAKNVLSNVPKEILNVVAEKYPDGKRTLDEIPKFVETKAKVQDFVPEEKLASVTGLTEKTDNIKSEIKDLEEKKKSVTPAIAKEIDLEIAEKNKEVDFYDNQIKKVIKSKDETGILEEVDDVTGLKAGEQITPKEFKVTEEVTPTEVKVTEDIESKKSSIEKERQADLDDLKKGIPAMITKNLESDLKQYGFTDAEINKMTPIVANEKLIDAKYKAKLSSLEGVKPEVKVTEEVKPNEVNLTSPKKMNASQNRYGIVKDGGEAGFIVATNPENNVVRIKGVTVNEELRGKNIAGDAYVKLGESLAKEGISLESDSFDKMEPSATRVWEKLADKGLAVKGKNSYEFKPTEVKEGSGVGVEAQINKNSGFDYTEDYYEPKKSGELAYKFNTDEGKEFNVSLTNINKKGKSAVLDFEGDFSWETMDNKSPFKTLKTVSNIIKESLSKLKKDGYNINTIIYDATEKKGRVYKELIKREYPNAEFTKNSFGGTTVKLGEPKAVEQSFKETPKSEIKPNEVKAEVKPTSLEDEYNSKSVDELIALKKKLYPEPDIEKPMTPEEKLLDRVIAKKFSEKNQEIIEKRKAAAEKVKPTEVKVKEEKTFAQKDLDRAEAKRIHSRVAEMDPPSDAEQVALRYLSEGGKVSQDAINEVSGTTKRASLNTGRRELKTEEAKARDYAGGKESLDDLAHRLWEASGQEISERDIKNALMAEIGNNNSRLDASKAYLERYNIEYQEEQYYERFIEEREEQHAKVQEELERDLRKPLEEEIEGMSSEEHINNLIKQYEAETKRENKQIGTEGKGEAVEEISSRDTGKKAPEEAELAKEYKEAVSKVSKKAKENAKKDFVDRNFDNLVEKLKIQIKCPT